MAKDKVVQDADAKGAAKTAQPATTKVAKTEDPVKTDDVKSEEVGELAAKCEDLTTEVETLQEDIEELTETVEEIKAENATLKTDLAKVNKDLAVVKTSVKRSEALAKKAAKAAGAEVAAPVVKEERPKLTSKQKQFEVTVVNPKTGEEETGTYELLADKLRDPRNPTSIVRVEDALKDQDLLCKLVQMKSNLIKSV